MRILIDEVCDSLCLMVGGDVHARLHLGANVSLQESVSDFIRDFEPNEQVEPITIAQEYLAENAEYQHDLVNQEEAK